MGIFPVLTACLLFRFGVLDPWYCAGIVAMGPMLESILFLWQNQNGLKRGIKVVLMTQAILYFAAIVFLLNVPEFNLFLYAIVFTLALYVVMFVSLTLLDRSSNH